MTSDPEACRKEPLSRITQGPCPGSGKWSSWGFPCFLPHALGEKRAAARSVQGGGPSSHQRTCHMSWEETMAGPGGGVAGLAPPTEPRGAGPRSLDLHAGLLGNGTLAAASVWSQALLLSKCWVPAAVVVQGSRAPGFEMHCCTWVRAQRSPSTCSRWSRRAWSRRPRTCWEGPDICAREARYHLRGPTMGSCPALRVGRPRGLCGAVRGWWDTLPNSPGVSLWLSLAPGLPTTILHTDNTASINATGTMDNI